MGARLRPGLVATIRVDPRNCQSVLHVLEAAGITSKDKSFAVCVSDALGILLESSRLAGVLPEPDPFQFLNELRYHVGKEAPDRRKKAAPSIQAAKQITRGVAKHETLAPEVALPVGWVDPTIPTDPMKLMQYKAAKLRLVDSDRKKQEAEISGVVWSDKEEAQYQKDVRLVYDGIGYEDAH